MSNFQEQLFDAIDIITKQRISEIKFDKTIEVIIINADKATSGEYQAQYQDLTITIYSSTNTIKYAVGDAVMVLVPQGDFGKKKTIVSSSGLKGEDFVDLEDLPSGGGEVIDKMGYNFVDEAEDFTITLPTNTNNTVTFNLKTKDMVTYYPYKKVIIVGMEVYTNINLDDTGDYGIAIDATFMNDAGSRFERTLKTRLIDIVGNPYQARGYKEIKIQLPTKERLVSVNRGYAYAEGFKLGVAENIVRFSELNIQYGTAKDIENVSEYSGNILAPKGTIFKSGSLFPTEKLELVMEVKKQGSVLDNNSELSYMWFEIDEDINNSLQEGYHPDAGYGWRWLKEDADGLTGFDKKALEIEAKYIPNFSSFKCIAKYKEFSVSANVVSITDNTDEITTSISSSSGYSFKNGIGSTILSVEVKNNGAVISNSELLFKWIKIAESGAQTVLRFTDVSDLPVDISTIGNRSTFICEIYKSDDNKSTISKGSTSLVVVFDAPVYGLSITGGFRSVLYDNEGNAPVFTPSQFNYTLFKNGEAVTTNLTQKWTIPNATTTMLTMEGATLETDNSQSSNAREVVLGIDKKFSIGKMDNVLKLTVTHTEGDITEVFTEYAIVSITKVGDTGASGPAGSQGVDGNTYVYEIQDGVRTISYDQNGLTPNPKETGAFNLVFYKNGSDVTSELNSVTWTLPDDSLLTFKNSARPKTVETVDGVHIVTLVADDRWDDKKFNNVLKAEFKYNNITFREYTPITINKNAKDGEKGEAGLPGAQGESGYTVMLTNENHTFPAGKDGALLVGEAKTSIIALKGTSPVTFTVDPLPTLENFTISRVDDLITIKTKEETVPKEDAGSFDIGINIDNKKFIKTFVWSLARRGENGESAKYVVLAGEQIFTCGPGYTAPYSPPNITITSASYGITETKRTWSFRRAGEQTVYIIDGETDSSIVIQPDDYEMWKSASSISLKCSVDGFADEMTIAKVANGLPGANGSNGVDGTSPYIILLDSSNGLIFKDGIVSTVITATLMKGEEVVPMTAAIRNKLFWEKVDRNGNITSTQNGTFSPTYVSGQKEKISIGSNDIIERATFNCGLLD